MKTVKEKIKANSLAIFAGLLIIAVIVAALAVHSTVLLVQAYSGIRAEVSIFKAVVQLIQQYGMAVLIGFVAFIFRKIGQNETPFFKGAAWRIKFTAVILFVLLALPRWVANVLYLFGNTNEGFVIADSTVLLGFVVAAVVYCFGQIFKYGYLLQEENDELL